MHNFSRLNESIKQIAKGVYESIKPTTIMFGKVISEKPLKINLEQKLTLGENQLILSRNVTDYKTKITIPPTLVMDAGLIGNVEGYHGPGVLKDLKLPSQMDTIIHNGLKEGEDVILLRLEGGQKFLVIDRLVK